MTETLVKWLTFRVLLGFLPVAMNALRVSTDQGLSSLSFAALFSRGELLLIACAVTGGAIGELTTAPKRFPSFRLWCMWGCTITLASCAYWYAHVAGLITSGRTYDTEFVAAYSVMLYILGLSASLGCVVISELSKTKTYWNN